MLKNSTTKQLRLGYIHANINIKRRDTRHDFMPNFQATILRNFSPANDNPKPLLSDREILWISNHVTYKGRKLARADHYGGLGGT